MADSRYLVAVALIVSIILFSGCAGQCPPAGLPQPPGCAGGAVIQQNETSTQNVTTQLVTQPSSGSADEFGCLPSDCSTSPAGAGRQFCEEFKAGTYVWAPDCSAYPSEECRDLCDSRSKTGSTNGVIFEVEVPANTPSDAVIFMEITYPGDSSGAYFTVQMIKVNSSTWSLTLQRPAGTVHYRYTQGNMAFLSAEEFSPDSDDTKHSATVKPGDVIKDNIAKWRWFPAPGEALPIVDNAAASTVIAGRANGEKFQRGYMLVDFWWVPMKDLIAPTDAAMKASHGDWVQIRPAWDYIQTSPTPILGFEGFGHTYKPGDLEFNIAQSRKDGLNVLLIPQVCCNNPPGDATQSQSWWNSWFDQMENYSIHFADIAESNNVPFMIMQDDYLWGTASGQVPDISERYAHYIFTVKQHYSGKLGYFVSTGASYKSPGDLYPSLNDIKTFSPEQFDFFAVSMWTGVTDSNQPTVSEMKTNFKKIFDSALKPIYNTYHKPLVIVSAAYPSIDGGMKGTTGVFDNDIQVWYNYTNKYPLDLVEQAEGYEALMQAIAETPYITGLYSFTYWPLPLPESKEFNIRGKPSEQVVSAWYEQYEKQGK